MTRWKFVVGQKCREYISGRWLELRFEISLNLCTEKLDCLNDSQIE